MQWNAEFYKENHGFVANYGFHLMNWLMPQSGECILDLGCGTGELSHEIYSQGAQVTAIDLSPEMVAYAMARYGNQPACHFHLGDAAALTQVAEFDAVFSNATLHWVKDHVAMARGVARALKPGGRFVFEFGGKGNVAQMESAFAQALHVVTGKTYQSPWYFPSLADYASLLERHGLEVRRADLFERPTLLQGQAGLRNWYTQFLAAALHDLSAQQQEAAFQLAEATLRQTAWHDGAWAADYRRLRMLAVRI